MGLSILAFSACQSAANNKTSVSIEEFHNNWQEKDFTLLDVRSPEEFTDGHIKGAVLIPFNSGNFEAEIEKLPKDSELVIYCHSGTRARNAIEVMKGKGFENIILLEGSYSAWKEKGYPIEK